MKRFLHHSDITRAQIVADDPAFVPPLLTRGLTAGSSACCCPAPARYAVYLTAFFARLDPPEILLCAHHLRAAAVRLARFDVAVYDAAGCYVDMQRVPPVDELDQASVRPSTLATTRARS